MKEYKNSSIPIINRLSLEQLYGDQKIPEFYNDIPLTPYVPLANIMPEYNPYRGGNTRMSLAELKNLKSPNKRFSPSFMRTKGELTDKSGRYPYYMPNYDNEDAYGQNQHWTSKMVNGVTKGLALTGTTFLQTTVGAINGVIQAKKDGRFASFYDNDFNRELDEFNKELEKKFASYETKQFRDARWYSSDYLFTGNFLWEGVVKNLGFAAGAALSGNAFATALRWTSRLPGIARLASTGKMAEAIAKSEAAISGVKGLGKTKQMSDNLLTAYSALNKGQRAVVAGLATTGEAGIEAYHNLNEWRQNAIDNFIEETGREPNAEELKKINALADEVGNASFAANMGLLSATNYIQFPKILGSSYKAEKGILNEFAAKTGKLTKEGGEYISKKPGFARKVGNALTNPYLFSYSEAFEEGSQYAISKGTEHYYDKKYNNEDHDWFESLLAGYKDVLLTDEGMKNVLIGGLSGALMLGRGRYLENKKTKQNTADALRSEKWSNQGLNSAKLSDFTKDSYDAVVRGTQIQQDREDHLKNGDILNSKDAEADYIINYLSPRIKHGRFDLVMADIQDYKNLAMTEEGWDQLTREGIAQEGDTREAFLDRLSHLEKTANNVKSLYQSLNLRYKGAIDENGDRIYSDEVIDKMVYAASKISDYDNRYASLSGELVSNQINIDEISESVINKENEVINAALKAIKSDKNLNVTQKEELAQKVKDAAQIAVRRNDFLEEYNKIKEAPNLFKTKTSIDVGEVKEGEVIKVKTGNREQTEVTIGKPYYLVENYKPSKDGVRPRRKAYKVQLLKQNPDGSVEIQFENGTVKTVTPEQLSQYNLGSIEKTENNPKAKYVLENLDEEFVHYGITQEGKTRKGDRKKEEPAKGVLEYDSENDAVMFVWTSPYGKPYKREVTNTMFVAKEGTEWQGGMIRRTGTTLTEKQKAAEKKFLYSDISISERMQRRANVANNLYEKLSKELKTIANKIASNNQRLNQLDEEIANAYKTKTGQPRKRITKSILKLVEELEQLRESLPAENQRLQEQQILLEGELDIVKEYADNIMLTPASGHQMMEDLKGEMEDLKSMIGLTKDAIKQTERQLPLVEELYKRALELLNNFIDRIASLNPGLPLSIEEYRTNMERFLGEEGAEGVISNKEGFTAQILDVENTILSYTEGLKYPQHEKRFLEMSKNLQEMKKELPQLEANLRAQQKILDAFREFYKEQQELKKAEEILKDSSKVDSQLHASLDTSGETVEYDPDFKPMPRKADNVIPTATIVSPADSHDYQKRSNEFGFKLPKLQEARKNIEAVYVTKQTEAELGMEGLIDKLRTDEDGKLKKEVKAETIIAVVMVTETEDGTVPVNLEGDPITGNKLDEGIYQVMPMETLSWSNGESMFRNPESNAAKEITKRYTKWRAEVLSRKTIDSAFTPKSSFGILSFEEGQRTSVNDAGFASENDIRTKLVINVSTTQDILTKGTTSYPNPYKRVLIETDNGYAQLQNKQHTKEQATTIFRAIQVLTEQLLNEEDGLKTKKAARILDFLKGVVYWGLPTDKKNKIQSTGYSAIYFKTPPGAEYPVLYVGRKNKFVMSPTALRAHSVEIIEAIQELYTNTSYNKVKKMDSTFEEIVNIDEEGNITETVIWPNYQTYLLSAFLPNKSGEGMSNKKRKSIPLTTVANPITESNPVNRTGIYFYNPEAQEHYTVKAAEKVNFVKDSIKSEKEITDADVIAEVENFSPELKEELSKKPLNEKAEWAKGQFIAFAVDLILSNEEAVKSISDPKASSEKKMEMAVAFFESAKDLSRDKIIANLWKSYHILKSIQTKTQSDIDAEISAGFGAISSEDLNEDIDVGLDTLAQEGFGQITIEDAENTDSNTDTDKEVKKDKLPLSTRKFMKGRAGRKRDLRKKLKERYKKITPENWVKAEKWLTKNFPNIPVYRLKTIIENTNGEQAWGMFEDGAIYVYEGAEIGTVYHEVFEAVWKMFTPVEEQHRIITEFKERKGTFTDRPTGATVKYSEATDFQIKEQLAEEFRLFINRKGLPAKGIKGYVLKLFRDLKQFIKDFILKLRQPGAKSNIKDLFKLIESGHFRKHMPYATQLSFAQKGIIDTDEYNITDDTEFSLIPGSKRPDVTLIPGLTDMELNEVIDEMIYLTVSEMIATDKDLFSEKSISVSNDTLYQYIKDAIEFTKEEAEVAWVAGDIDIDTKIKEFERLERIDDSVKNHMDLIKDKFKSRIASYGLKIDENENTVWNPEDKIRNSDYVESTKVDRFKKMNKALKLLFSTVGVVNQEEYDIASSIGGVHTLPFGVVTNTLMKRLYKSRNIAEMQESFRQLAQDEPNFRKLYKRFFKASYLDEGAKLSNIDSTQSFRLISGLWKTFSSQAPAVKNVFILENGEIEVGDANLSTAGVQARNSFMNNIILRSKSGYGFFTYSSSKALFSINKKKLAMFTDMSTVNDFARFLSELGVDFTKTDINRLSETQYNIFKEVVGGIKMSLDEVKDLRTLSSSTLNLHGRLFKLGLLKAAVTNDAFETTFFNVVGERQQTFIGNNSPSRLFRMLSQINNINELEGTEFEYLIPGKDAFASGSIIISKMFDENGDKIPLVKEEEMLATGYVSGTVNSRKGKNTESKKLKLRDRFLQELNLNLKGWYLNLVPGDSSTEWMTFMDNHITESVLNRVEKEGELPNDVHNIFKKYFIAEVNTSNDTTRQVHKDRRRKDLRFFKSILDPETLAKVRASRAKGETVYTKNEAAIRRAVEAHVKNNTNKLRKQLNKFQAIQEDSSGIGRFKIDNVNIKNVTEAQLDTKLTMLTINYMINNIEQHKLVYGDPFQYKDQLKRTKSFQSPRQEVLHSENQVNELMHKLWNRNYSEGSIGFTNFIRDYFRTATLSDVKVVSVFKKYGIMDETDGGGIIALKAHRVFKIHSSDWTEDNERQYEYEVKWEETFKEGMEKVNKGELTLEKLHERLRNLKNPKVRDTFTAIKPVVTGNKYGSQINATVLDKYSLYPITMRMMYEMGAKNGVALHNKMQAEDIDYVIFNSGRKVGAYDSASAYNEDGSFNTEPFPESTIINIGFSTMGLQTEVPSKEKEGTTPRGSQATKIITMDRMKAGVPIDFMTEEQSFSKRFTSWNELSEDEKQDNSDLYNEIVINKDILNHMIEHGYESLLKKLKIEELPNGTVRIPDFARTVELIKNEIESREVNDNVINALTAFMYGNSVLEATPAYRQVSNILYSFVDKHVVSGKLPGGMKVQIPSTFWEENRLGIQEINGKKGYTSDALKIYEDEATGDNVMEIFTGRWFHSTMSDEELINYLNNTKKGQEILRGFAFRIPTQNMNSIDAFRIKKFLPEEFGDNVVVPSAIVGKVGSDFDIDKLTMYLKNVFVTESGDLEAVRDFGTGKLGMDEARLYAREHYTKKLKILKGKFEGEYSRRDLFSDIALGLPISEKKYNKWLPIFKEWFRDILLLNPDNIDSNGDLKNEITFNARVIEEIYGDRLEKLNTTIDKLSDAEAFEAEVDSLADKLYIEGLQNAYIESNIRLLTHPTNHTKLTSPNSAKPMQDLADKINEKLGNDKLEYSNPINFLDRVFMTNLRHNFVAGKGGIAIAAIGQTNHANNQLGFMHIDRTKIKDVPFEERQYLGDGIVKFQKVNSITLKGKTYQTLSMIYNKTGEYISDILGMFIDGYVDISNGPWIMQMGATPETTGTWQFLVKLGVPLEDVAFFMNQPIIRDYLQMIENKGYSWLFIDDYVDELKFGKYDTKTNLKMQKIPPAKLLWQTIGAENLNDIQKAQQHFYLDEFLKYAMMSRHLLYVTQGTNFDTATFNNPYLLSKKEKQLEAARNSVISSPDTLLANTFIGNLKKQLWKSRSVNSKILISDKPSIRQVINRAMEPYIHLNDREYVKMVDKMITTLFDWAVQTRTHLNESIPDLLINRHNVAQRMNEFLKLVKADPTSDLAENYVIKLIEILPSKSSDGSGTDNIKIKLRDTGVYDQNRLIYAFRELKEVLGDETDLYNALVEMAILQSGLAPSTISFTSLLPFEDFSSKYNETLSLLEEQGNLDLFNELKVFERNNWHNSDVVSYSRARWIPTVEGPRYNPGMAFLPNEVKEAVKKGEIPQVVRMPVGISTRNSHIVFSWEDQLDEMLTKSEKDILKKTNGNQVEYLNKKKEAMRNRGDFSFMHKLLLQRVNNEDGTPYETTINDKKYYLYKGINAWGNGIRANEFYDMATTSVIENNFEKVNEASDRTVLAAFNKLSKRSNSKSNNYPTLTLRSDNIKKVLAGTKTTTLRPKPLRDGIYNIGGKEFRVEGRGFLSVEEAGGVEAITKSENFGPKGPKFPHTKEFLKGERNLYVYDISPLGTDPLESFTKDELLEDYDQNTGVTLGERVVNPKKKDNTMTLKGKTYKFSQITSELLASLGYSKEKAGEILKIVCK